MDRFGSGFEVIPASTKVVWSLPPKCVRAFACASPAISAVGKCSSCVAREYDALNVPRVVGVKL